MNPLRVLMLLAALAVLVPARAAIQGSVFNGSSGRPQAGVEVTLVKLEEGMTPAGSTKTDAGGKFHFSQNPTGTGGRPVPLLLRADFEGVTYNQMIQPEAMAREIRLMVYRSVPASGASGAPQQHVLLFEPSGRELLVNESFLYQNQAQPPVTYVSDQGTLRFYLPPGAKGTVQVNTVGPGGMPVRGTAEKTSEPDIYKVIFPIKPGESRIDLTYSAPFQSPLQFDVRTLYPGVATRLAAPAEVSLSGEGMQPLGEEPQSKAAIFGVPERESYRVTIAGEGRLARGGGQQEISVVPAGAHEKRWLIFAFAAGILGLGFYGLYTASGAGAAEKPARAPKKRGK